MTASLVLGLGSTWQARALDPNRSLSQFQSRRWGPEEGLPCNNVLSVIQTSDGYLWLGTEEGLVRFDGVRAVQFERPLDQTSGGDDISDVIECSRHPGNPIFVSSTGSLGQCAEGRIQVVRTSVPSTHQPGHVLVQNPQDGALWVGTVHGLFRVSPRGEVTAPGAVSSEELPAEPITTLCRDAGGRLWAGSARGIYRQREAGDGRRFELLASWKGGAVDCISPARGGGLWIGAPAVGVGLLGEDDVFHPRSALGGGVISSLLEDRSGMLWVGTFGSGLYRLPGAPAGATSQVVSTLTTANGLVDNQVNSLCEDREGNVWIGTEKGLQVLQDTRFVNYGLPEGLAGENVTTVFEDRLNRVWIGTMTGLGMLNAARDHVQNFATPPSPRRPNDDLVLCLGPGDDDQTVLAGTHAGLVRWQKGRLDLWPLRDDLDGSAVRALCVDANGDRWIGSGNGLFRVRGDRVVERLTTADGLTDNVVRCLHLDPRGNLWIGTDGGLSRRTPDGRITDYLTKGVGSVLSVIEEPSGARDLFVGSDFGLHRLHPTADGIIKVTSYTVRDGLFDNTMWSLLDDGRGALWMSSNKGIARVTWANLDRFDRHEVATIHAASFGVQDGLRSREANGGHQPTAWRDHSGVLWFATVKGAASVDPASVHGPGLAVPPVRIEDLTADGHPVPLNNGRVPALPAGTQKFELRYTALSYLAPESNQFRYRLAPFDAQWNDAGKERVAHYTNLPPGRYRFMVRAANSEGVWNEEGAALAFVLRPHFYQIIWVQLLAAAMVLAAGWHWLRAHKRQLVARMLKAEADVRERTRYEEILRAAKEEAERARAEAERASNAKSEFLSRVSHELRTPLNAILGFGQILEMNELAPAQAKSVAHILRGGRHLLDLVNEVLDLARIESGKIELHLEDIEVGLLLRESVDLVVPLARERGVLLHLDPAAHAEPICVCADRQRLRQVLLNLLGNAVKYNRPADGEVFIEVLAVPGAADDAVAARWLRLQVRDTGAGMSAEGIERLFTPFERLGAAHGPIKGTGLGLAVSKQLVDAMQGRIGVESIPGVGSTFWVELPESSCPAAVTFEQHVVISPG